MDNERLLKKVPRLMVFNAKGGVGKTGIALNIALTYGYGLITNDKLTIADSVLPSERCLILEDGQSIFGKDRETPFTGDLPIVYDFGGYPDQRALDALSVSSFLLVPVLANPDVLRSSLNFVEEVRSRKRDAEIIVLANQTVKNQYYDIRDAFNRFYPNIRVFNIKKTAAFAWMLKHGMSIRALGERYAMYRRHFSYAAGLFDHLMEHLRDGNI